MSRFYARFFPPLGCQERERRLRLFRALLAAQLVATGVLIGNAVWDLATAAGTPRSYMFLVPGLCVVLALFAIGGYLIARRAAYYAGVYFLILSLLCFLDFFVAFYGTHGPIPFHLIWPVMVAAILLEPAAGFVVAGLAAVAHGGLVFVETTQLLPLPLFRAEYFILWHRPDPEVTMRVAADAINVALAYYVAAFLSWIASRSLHQAVRHAQEQNVELEAYRAELEQRVAARTEQLNQALRQLETSLETIREVGSPVLPIMEQVLLVPLIGALDSARMSQILDQVLAGVSKYRSRVVIIDVTGVPVVDTAVADALLKTAQGIRLLGATPVLVGIRGEVAQTMVGLGVDLRRIVTRAGLQEGLEYARESLGASARL